MPLKTKRGYCKDKNDRNLFNIFALYSIPFSKQNLASGNETKRIRELVIP
jgi:hypothetical protein